MNPARPNTALLPVLALLLTAPVAAASLSEVAAAPRVQAARASHGELARELFRKHDLPYPARIYLRAFKREGELELWAGKRGEALQLLKVYPVCARSGELGPKRQRGDLQVPEGFYALDRYNAWSNFLLSLGMDYPNALDRKLKSARDPGGDIFIHGDCVTIGCLPLEDGPIQELFLIALDARRAGQKRVPVHVFPTRMDDAGMAFLVAMARAGSPHLKFWQELRPAYQAFEQTHRVPRTWIDRKRWQYRVKVLGEAP